MTVKCTTSSLPAIGSPLAVPATPVAGKVIGAARKMNRARRGFRRARRALVIVTCVTAGSAAAAAGAKYLPPLFAGQDAPQRAAVVGASGYGDYGDYARLQRSVAGPSFLPLVTGQSRSMGGYGQDGVTGGSAGGSNANEGRLGFDATPHRRPVSVPEPGALGLILAGVLGWFGLGRRKPAAAPDSKIDDQARQLLADERAAWEAEVKVIGRDAESYHAGFHDGWVSGVEAGIGLATRDRAVERMRQVLAGERVAREAAGDSGVAPISYRAGFHAGRVAGLESVIGLAAEEGAS
jgi:hypothetical protein